MKTRFVRFDAGNTTRAIKTQQHLFCFFSLHFSQRVRSLYFGFEFSKKACSMETGRSGRFLKKMKNPNALSPFILVPKRVNVLLGKS